MILFPGLFPIDFVNLNNNRYCNKIEPFYFYDYFIVNREFLLP